MLEAIWKLLFFVSGAATNKIPLLSTVAQIFSPKLSGQLAYLSWMQLQQLGMS